VAVVTVSDPRDESPAQLRLKDQQEPSAAGPGLAARRYQSWASRFDRGQGGAAAGRSEAGLGTGMEVFSYLIAGMLAYGGIGWLVGRAVHIELLFPVGMGVGLVITLGWVIYRYGRVGADRKQ
jgi:F0F1-type ATP synthase assembly protein I